VQQGEDIDDSLMSHPETEGEAGMIGEKQYSADGWLTVIVHQRMSIHFGDARGILDTVSPTTAFFARPLSSYIKSTSHHGRILGHRKGNAATRRGINRTRDFRGRHVVRRVCRLLGNAASRHDLSRARIDGTSRGGVGRISPPVRYVAVHRDCSAEPRVI
jgi:hypothetical protein